jgi:serine/threonine-protein kinase
VLPNGRVHEAKIIDFGIAKLLEQGEGTIVDGFKGKLSYASPEQLGFFGGKLDGRSDLYSLGLVLAAAALGRPMAMGTSVMEAVDARRSFRALPDAIPVGLRSAIQPLLALDPNDRPQYVDRLFVAPGAFDGAEDSDSFGASTTSRASVDPRRPAAPPRTSRTPLIAGLATAAVLLIAAGIYLVPRAESTPAPTATSTATAATTTAGVSGASDAAGVAATPAASSVAVVAADTARPEVVVAPVPAPAPVVAAVKPAPARQRGPSASDRLRIVGMLTNAKLALGENRLMSPPGDNAYDRYRSVLRLEPGNQRAKSGLRDIAARYVKRANEALDQGDAASARDHLRHARQADASHTGIRAVEQRLATGS